MTPSGLTSYWKKGSLQVRLIKLVLKILVTSFCFWYISEKVNFKKAFEALGNANWAYLFLALLFFILSKILAAHRLDINFRNIKLYLPTWINIKLYWLGMFYNLFLPGAISGDAYKVILLKRRYKADVRKVSAAVFLDRISGVLALGVIISLYAVLIIDNSSLQFILIAGTMIAMAVTYWIVRLIMKDFIPGFFTTFYWGLAVQFSQVVCIYFIMLSVHISLNQHQWILIFLGAAIISVLPISLGGGLGTREVVFAEGARFFNLDPPLGVVISLLFYLITVAGSAWGAYYIFNDPLKDEISV